MSAQNGHSNGAGAMADAHQHDQRMINTTSTPTVHELRGGQLVLPEESSEAQPMYVCRECGTQLALQDELISKSFSGRQGRAYLFHSAINASVGASEDRQLMTGMHTVADVACIGCGGVIGWTYLKAWEPSQKYKEGRFILESVMLSKVNNWS